MLTELLGHTRCWSKQAEKQAVRVKTAVLWELQMANTRDERLELMFESGRGFNSII